MPDAPTVPLLDLKAQYAAIKPEIDAALHEVVASQYFVLGPAVERLEHAIAEYIGSRFAIGCASGSDALLLALMALDVGPGDEVICPAYTFFATAGSISRLGARPVFGDIDPATYNLSPEHTRQLASKCSRLKAIMPVHLYGQAADLEAFLALGEQLGVPIIEDAAQAIGARDEQGTPVGRRGAFGCFSFFPSKNLGGFGDGGLVTSDDPELAELVKILRMHGGRTKYVYERVGMNSRLDALQAVVLEVKLRHLESWHEQRRKNADRYDRIFMTAGAKSSEEPLLSGGLPLRTPHRLPSPSRHIYNQYVIRVPAEARDGVREHLKTCHIGTEIYYPLPLHLQECFSGLGGREGDLPESERAARETIALPIYPELTGGQIDFVAGSVLEALSRLVAPAARSA